MVDKSPPPSSCYWYYHQLLGLITANMQQQLQPRVLLFLMNSALGCLHIRVNTASKNKANPLIRMGQGQKGLRK